MAPHGTAEQLPLHHVGIVVRDVEAAAAEHAARSGWRLRGPKVHDPVQTAWVQFLESRAGGALLELVAPDGPGSRLARALARGGGLHHLCYATPEIEATCAVWRARGCLLIHPPVPAAAFGGRRIAWLMGRDCVLVELVEQGRDGGF